jgi:hypothetical protein
MKEDKYNYYNSRQILIGALMMLYPILLLLLALFKIQNYE